MGNLREGLIDKINNARDLLRLYEDLGAPGIIGASLIRADIKEAENAMGLGDVVVMLKCYQNLSKLK